MSEDDGRRTIGDRQDVLAPVCRLSSFVRPASVVAVTLTAAYAACIAWLAVLQHDSFHTRARDMGIYAQVLWNSAHGRPFASTLLADNTLHLAEHVAPVLAPLTTLYAILPDPRMLLVAQQVFLAASGLPIFLWARRRVGDLPALVILIGYFAMPAMSRVALSEFHPIVMAAFPIAMGLVATLEGRVRAAAVWLVIALLFEEETAPLAGAAGAYLLLVQRRRIGLAIGALSVIWLVATVFVFMPAFHDRRTLADAGGNRTTAHFDQVRDDPSVVLDWIAGARGLEAVTWLLGPTAGLPVLAPSVLALAAPSFAVQFLQDREGAFAGHWSAATLPVYWLAAAAGMARLRLWSGRRSGLITSGAVIALVVVSGVSYLRFSLFPGGRGYDEEHFVWTKHEADLASTVADAPITGRLDATRRLVPHLANRFDVYQFPSTFYTAPMRPNLDRIEVFVLDLTDSPTRRALDATDQDTVMTSRPRMHARVYGADVVLLSRERPVPEVPHEATYGGALRMNGHDLERRGAALRISPHWEPVTRVGDWTRIAELVGPDGGIVDRDERIPLDPYLPPSRWDRRQVIVESIDLTLPTAAAPGPYRVVLRWVDESGATVPLADGSDGAVIEIDPSSVRPTRH